MHTTDLVIVGAGGHASDVVGLVEDLVADGARWNLIGLVADQPPPVPARFEGRAAYLGAIDLLPRWRAHGVVAVGYPQARFELVSRIAPHVRQYATLIHPEARLGTGTTAGGGTVLPTALMALKGHAASGLFCARGWSRWKTTRAPWCRHLPNSGRLA